MAQKARPDDSCRPGHHSFAPIGETGWFRTRRLLGLFPVRDRSVSFVTLLCSGCGTLATMVHGVIDSRAAARAARESEEQRERDAAVDKQEKSGAVTE